MKRFLLLTIFITYSAISFAQVSGGSFTASTCVTGDLNWTNPGAVNTILIFAKAGSAITTGTPTNNESTYTANPAFGSGTAYQNDATAFCVYKSTTTGTTASITGLTPGVTYHFLAYNVNGTTYSAVHAFSGSTPALADITTLTAAPDNGQISLTWNNPSCFDEILIVAKPTSTIAGTPTGDGTAYTADANFSGAGTTFDATGKVVYKNNTSSVTVTGLTNGTTYFFRAYTRKGTTWSAGSEISAIPYEAVSGGTFNTDICLTIGTASWTNPATVSTIIVFAKAGSAINSTPPTNSITTYTANSDFSGAGTVYQHDASAKCVYKGTGNSLNLTGLTAGTTYHFLVFNANGTSYSLPHTFNGSTLTTPPNTTGLGTTPAATSIALAWTNPFCFDEVLVVAKTSTIAGTPTGDGTAYTANNDFTGGGTAFDGSGKVVYKGTGTSVNVIGLTTSTTYFLKIFTRKGTTWSVGTEVSDLTICTPDDVSALKISDANTTANLYWTDPACFDQVMIVAKQGTASVPATITLAPTGNGSAYTANANFTAGGTAFDGGKVVFKSGTNPGAGGFQTTNLTTGLIYTFKVFTRKGTTWTAGATITTVPGPPVLIASSLVPADGSTGVSTEQIFTATFNEKIYASHTTASGTDDDIEFDPASGTSQFIARGAGAPALTLAGRTASLEVSGGLTELSTVYNILIGNKVLTDSTGNVSPAAGGVNDFVGTTSGTWNFTTASGVALTTPTVGTCVNQFTSLGDIVITEAAANNFQGTDNGSFTLVLGFDKTGYIFNPGTTGVTATFLPGGDILSITVTSVTFTQAIFTIQFADVSGDNEARNNMDAITISGLKVSRDGSMAPPAIIFAATATTLPVQGLTEGSTLLGTINGGTVPAAPTISQPSGNNSYCVNATFTGINITASDPDGPAETFNWYNDAALTSVNAINANSRTIAQLIGGSPAPGTYTRYATQVDGCESVASTITITITALPVANAGADLLGVNAVCPNASVILGGSPTATGGSGSYTYAWTGPGSPSPDANPNHVVPDPGATNQIYNYQVIVTDGNGCVSAPDVKQVEVKNLSENILITQPGIFTYTTNNNPVNLEGSPANGVFTGVGVIELDVAYQFDPELAGIGTWPVTYTATLTNGCTKAVTQNFDVTTPYDVFPNLDVKYCNTEGTVSLTVSPAMLTEVQNFIDNWNTVYVPNYGYGPLKATFTGLIRNEYEASYGDNNAVVGTTFYPSRFATDASYPNCATCYDAFIAIFVEFVSPANTYPYNYGTADYGWYVNNGSTLAAFEFRGEYVRINPVPVVNFSGLTNPYCNINVDYQLTGNKPGGFFEISSDGINFADEFSPDPVDGIKDFNEGIPAGLGEFNPLDAVGGGIVAATNRWIRYSVDPGTTGTAAFGGCIGRQTQSVTIYPADPIVFQSSVPVAPLNEFCYEGASFPITVELTAGGGALTTGVSFSGFGISDNGSGVGTFTPKTAFDQQAFGSTSAQTIVITATYTNPQGCAYQVTRSFIVRPKPSSIVLDAASPNPPIVNTNFCYNDASVGLVGNTSSSVRYEIEYISLNYTRIIPTNTFTFDPSVFYDSAVVKGLTNVSDATFNINYIVTDAIGCTASSTRLFAVSPLAEIIISGITDGERFCSNTQPFPITFSPKGGTFLEDGVPRGLSSESSYSSALLPIGDNYTIEYEYSSGVSQCITTEIYTISKISAPLADFDVNPVCDGDAATFLAAPDADNYTWKWVLGDSVRSGTGNQTINHVFPGLSQGATQTSYLIRLIVENGPGALKVCRDSTEAIQVIGAYPRADFNYADVCENDFTRFTVSSNIPIATAEWNFGDGYTLPDSTLNTNIGGSDLHDGRTQGKYGLPEHSFNFTPGIQNRYDVELIARTAKAVGGCQDTISRQVAILEKRIAPYTMAALGSGNGLWIEEDRADSSTWEFAIPAAKLAMTADAGAAWVTNANGPYKARDNSFVNSPCFDLSGVTKPVISIQYWSNSDLGKDGAILQYSTDGGATWLNTPANEGGVVGTPTSGVNWYSNTTIASAPGGYNQYGWTGRQQAQWLTGKNSLDAIPEAKRSNVRFRIAFSSDEREEYDGFAFNNVVIEDRNRIMLVEHFANADTDNTAIAISKDRFNTHAPLNDAEIVKIQYNTSFPDADPINAANPEDHNARAAFYGATNQSIPLGFIDGGRDLLEPFGFASPANPDNGWWNDYKQKRSLSASPYSLTVVSLPTDSLDYLKIHVTGSRDGIVPGSKPVLHVAVIEKNVAGGNEHVMRKLLPNAGGTPLNPLALTINDTLYWAAEGVTDLSEIAIVAFIQDEITKEIHQAAIDLNPVHKPTEIITGIEDPSYANQIGLYPNPASSEVNIQLPEAVSKPTPVELYDAYGRVVYQSIFKVGQKTIKVSTSTFANGIYMMQIITPQGGKAVRKIMVKH
jgi:hypothetical protein